MERRSRRKYAVFVKLIGLVGPKTEQAITNIEAAVRQFDEPIAVEWISDPFEMARLGPMQIPSLYVNSDLRVAGRVPSVHEVRVWVEEVLRETVAA